MFRRQCILRGDGHRGPLSWDLESRGFRGRNGDRVGLLDLFVLEAGFCGDWPFVLQEYLDMEKTAEIVWRVAGKSAVEEGKMGLEEVQVRLRTDDGGRKVASEVGEVIERAIYDLEEAF